MGPSWVNQAGLCAFLLVFLVLGVREALWLCRYQVKNFDLKFSEPGDMNMTQWSMHIGLLMVMLFLVLGVVFAPVMQGVETLLLLGMGVFGVIGLGWFKDVLERTYGAWDYMYED